MKELSVELLNDIKEKKEKYTVENLSNSIVLSDIEVISENLEKLLNIQDSSGMTMLMYACLYRCVDIVKVLLDEFNVDINASSNKKNTALHIACTKGFEEIIELLILRGANVTLANDEGKSPLNILKEMHPKLNSRLLNSGLLEYITSMSISPEDVDIDLPPPPKASNVAPTNGTSQETRHKISEPRPAATVTSTAEARPSAPKPAPGKIHSKRLSTFEDKLSKLFNNTPSKDQTTGLENSKIEHASNKDIINKLFKVYLRTYELKADKTTKRKSSEDEINENEKLLKTLKIELEKRIANDPSKAEVIVSLIDGRIAAEQSNLNKAEQKNSNKKYAITPSTLEDFRRAIYKELKLEDRLVREDVAKFDSKMDQLKQELMQSTADITPSEAVYQEALKGIKTSSDFLTNLKTKQEEAISIQDKLLKNEALQKSLAPIFNNSPEGSSAFNIAETLRRHMNEANFKLTDDVVIRYIENTSSLKTKFEGLFSNHEAMFDGFNAGISFDEKVRSILTHIDHKDQTPTETINKPEESKRLAEFFGWYEDIFGQFKAGTSFDDKIRAIESNLSLENPSEIHTQKIMEYLTVLQRDSAKPLGLVDRFTSLFKKDRNLVGKKVEGQLEDKLEKYKDLQVGAVNNFLAKVEKNNGHNKKELTPILYATLKDTLNALKEETLKDSVDGLLKQLKQEFKRDLNNAQAAFNETLATEIINPALKEFKKADMFVESHKKSDKGESSEFDNHKKRREAILTNTSNLLKALYIGDQDGLNGYISDKIDKLAAEEKKKNGLGAVPAAQASRPSADDTVSLTDSESESGSISSVKVINSNRFSRSKSADSLTDRELFDDESAKAIKAAKPPASAPDKNNKTGGAGGDNQSLTPQTSSAGNNPLSSVPPHPYYRSNNRASYPAEPDPQLEKWGNSMLSNPMFLLLLAFFVLFAPMVIVIPTLVAVGVVMKDEEKKKLAEVRDRARRLDADNKDLRGCVAELQSDAIFRANNPFTGMDPNISDDEFKSARDVARKNYLTQSHDNNNYRGQ